jgi:hypothetical protein
VSQNLIQTEKSDSIKIDQVLFYKVTAGLLKITTEYGCSPGLYTANKENELGTYYKGERRPIWIHSEADSDVFLSQGGIWVPKDGGAPRLYAIFDNQLVKADHPDQVRNGTESLPLMQNEFIQNAGNTGKPLGASAVGSAIGFGIVGLIIQADVGKHNFLPDSSDSAFIESLTKAVHANDSSDLSVNSALSKAPN